MQTQDGQNHFNWLDCLNHKLFNWLVETLLRVHTYFKTKILPVKHRRYFFLNLKIHSFSESCTKKRSLKSEPDWRDYVLEEGMVFSNGKLNVEKEDIIY